MMPMSDYTGFMSDGVDAKFSTEYDDSTRMTATTVHGYGYVTDDRRSTYQTAAMEHYIQPWTNSAQSMHLRPNTGDWPWSIVYDPSALAFNDRSRFASNDLVGQPNDGGGISHNPRSSSGLSPAHAEKTLQVNNSVTDPGTAHIYSQDHDIILQPVPFKFIQPAVLSPLAGASPSFCASDAGTWSSVDTHELPAEPSPVPTVSTVTWETSHSAQDHRLQGIGPTDARYWSSTEPLSLQRPYFVVDDITGQQSYWTPEGKLRRVDDTYPQHGGSHDRQEPRPVPAQYYNGLPISSTSEVASQDLMTTHAVRQCQQPCCAYQQAHAGPTINHYPGSEGPAVAYGPIGVDYSSDRVVFADPAPRRPLAPLYGPIRYLHSAQSGASSTSSSVSSHAVIAPRQTLPTMAASMPDTTLQPHVNPSDLRTEDLFLVQAKKAGLSYKEIRAKGRFKEAESTLRGRFRALTKEKNARVRRPNWTWLDVQLLQEAVSLLSPPGGPKILDAQGRSRVQWKKVAQYIVKRGGSYHFGNATCKKKWDELDARA